MFVSVFHASSGPLSLSKKLNKFESIFEISRKPFHCICLLVREDLWARTIVFTCTDGKVPSVEDRIAVALRRLWWLTVIWRLIIWDQPINHPPSDLAICGGYGGEEVPSPEVAQFWRNGDSKVQIWKDPGPSNLLWCHRHHPHQDMPASSDTLSYWLIIQRTIAWYCRLIWDSETLSLAVKGAWTTS